MPQYNIRKTSILGLACVLSSFSLGTHASAQALSVASKNDPKSDALSTPVLRRMALPATPVKGQNVSDTTEDQFLPASLHDWLTQSTMTGNWAGARTRLARHGLVINGHYLQDSAGNVTGGRSKNVRYADEFGATLDADIKKLTGYSLGFIHFAITARQGLGLTSKLPVMNSPQEIFGSGETVRLTRLSWEMPWNQYVSTEVGEINSENDFEQSSIYWGGNLYCQFQTNAICGMPQSIAMNSGYGYYPTSHPGAWVKFYPAGNKEYLISFGAFSVDPTISNTHNAWKMNLHGATGTFLPFQLGWHRGGDNDFTGPLQTNIKVGGYWDTSQVKDVYSQLSSFEIAPQYLATAPVSKVRGRFGGWVQADRMLERDSDDPQRSTAVFGSFTWGDPRTAVVPYYVTFGIVRKGTFASRPNDTVSLGMKSGWVNAKLGNWARQMQKNGANLLSPSGEQSVELNYGWRPMPWLLVRPGAQYYWSPGGTNRYKNPVLLDLETGITF